MMAAEIEDMPDGGTSLKDVGLIDKYRVYKLVPCKSPGCTAEHRIEEELNEGVFVLKPESDPIARQALRRYAQVAHTQGYVKLARDLDNWVDRVEASASGLKERIQRAEEIMTDLEKFERAMDDEGETF